jgi:hypothetical protein
VTALLAAAGAGAATRPAAGPPLAAGPATRPTTGPAVTVPTDLEVKDVDGTTRRPLACGPAAKAAVVFFLSHDCPISNAYAPEVNRICKAYGADGRVAFSIVYPYRELTAAEARTHAKEYGYTIPGLIDTGP